MNNNLIIQIESLKNMISHALDNSGLHISIIKHVVDSIKLDIDEEYRKILFQEIQRQNNNQQVKQKTIPNEEIKEEKEYIKS